MATTPISAVGTGTTTTPTNRAMNGMRSEDFFQILVTELQQQDPLQPSKTADMIGQVSQIRSIELSQQLSEALGELTRQQHAAGAGDLLGRFVSATLAAEDGSTQEVSGVVTGVRFENNAGTVLELDTGQAIPLSSVTRMAPAPAAAAENPATTTPTGAVPADAATTAATQASGTAKSRQSAAAPQAVSATPDLIPWLEFDAGINL
jgi:flagellar basal-body rod modification protein FlgD